MLNHYLTEMVDIIFSSNGTLDKFIGDAVMAFWGAPLKSDTHAYDAIKASLEMCQKRTELNEQFKLNGWPEINYGIGVHTGTVILGNIGSIRHLDYTIIGDNVNLASRIEGLTKFYAVSLLITESTYERIHDKIASRLLDSVIVKGKTEAIKIYEPVAMLDTITDEQEFLISKTDQGFEYYQSESWDLAIQTYQDILERFPDDGISQIIIDRCTQYKKSPPDSNWAGHHIFDTK